MLDPRVGPGLCATCAYHRLITSDRSSEFWYCRMSETDATFPKYPMLPVVRCGGFAPQGNAISTKDEK
jgi:hypothetical protein